MTRRPGRRRNRVLPAALVLVALLAASCSDAHSQAQRDLSDPGYDPQVLTVLAPGTLVPVLRQLESAYQLVHPGSISLSLISQVQATSGKHRTNSTLTATQMVQAGARPSLWFDRPQVLGAWAKDPSAEGPVTPFASNQLVLLVKVGNPAHVAGLTAFEPGPPTTVRCNASAPCGKSAELYLKAAGYPRAVFEYHVPTPTAVIQYIQNGKADTGFVYGLDSVAPGIDRLPLPASPVPPFVPFSILRMTSNPSAASFVDWITTSPEARAIVKGVGLVPAEPTS